jgi:hypothetical protein
MKQPLGQRNLGGVSPLRDGFFSKTLLFIHP